MPGLPVAGLELPSPTFISGGDDARARVWTASGQFYPDLVPHPKQVSFSFLRCVLIFSVETGSDQKERENYSFHSIYVFVCRCARFPSSRMTPKPTL